MKRHATWLVPLGWGVVACTKIPAPPVGGMPKETLADSVSVPASWGNLVAVTVNPAFTDVEQLWFQDSVRQIHMVIYDIKQRHLVRVAPLITRR